MAAGNSNGRPGRPREWSQSRVRQELTAVLDGAREMPSARELNAIGRADLRHAIAVTGGVEYWARELGLRLRPHQLSNGASPAELLETATEVAGRLGYLPGANKLRQLGYRALALAVLKAGGSGAYCRRYGLPDVDGRSSLARAPNSSRSMRARAVSSSRQ